MLIFSYIKYNECVRVYNKISPNQKLIFVNNSSDEKMTKRNKYFAV